MRSSVYCEAVWKHIRSCRCLFFPNIINIFNIIFNSRKLSDNNRNTEDEDGRHSQEIFDEEECGGWAGVARAGSPSEPWAGITGGVEDQKETA